MNKLNKIFQKLLLITVLFSFIELNAQTGIGTTTPNASAKLDVSATNKGFLPPRVSLTSSTDVSTITSPATGLLIYCKGDAGLASGYYFWNGTAWATIATAGGSGSIAAEYGSAILSSNVAIASATPTDVLSFTLPSAGTWELIYFLRAQGAPVFAGEYGIYDPTETIVPNSEVLAAYGSNASTGTGVVRVTTTGAATYKIKAWASTGTYAATSENNGRTGVSWKKISGNAPVTGPSQITYGDVKTGFQAADHNGWIKLDGRLKSSLTSTQQAQATALGIGTNLPNATNSFLVQNGTTIGSVTSSNSKTISQANLPNINFPTATTSYNGDHSHSFTRPNGDQNYNNGSGNTWWGGSWGSSVTTSTNGGHTHTVTVSSGGSGTALDITPQSLSVNTFIYLGN
jgi:hypothetical protein